MSRLANNQQTQSRVIKKEPKALRNIQKIKKLFLREKKGKVGKEYFMTEVNIDMVSDRAAYPPGLRGRRGKGALRWEEKEKCS